MTATHSSAITASRRWIEEEFERFAAAVISTKNKESDSEQRDSVPGYRDARRSISAQVIYEHALELVASEGIDALTVRRLAAELQISTRTVYNRIGNRTNMIRELSDLHLARLDLVFESLGTWEDTTWAWCLRLHQALTAQPHLTHMAQDQTLAAVQPYVSALIGATVRQGIPHSDAVECCWSLANLIINDAIGTGLATLNDANVPRAARKCDKPSNTTTHAIKWITLGVRTAAGQTPTR